MRLCSACLLGIGCRYDGRSNPTPQVLALLSKELLIPVCPEQLGGLPTPREPAEPHGERIITISGKDVTENFIRGAEQVLYLAKLFGIQEAILKQGSPSCGCGQVYDLRGNILTRDGVTVSLLKQHGIRVISEDSL
ncbi:MAG: DUF523 domain-containing protein [Candidatus Hadarchaeum sp.]